MSGTGHTWPGGPCPGHTWPHPLPPPSHTRTSQVILYERAAAAARAKGLSGREVDFDAPELEELIEPDLLAQLREDVELLQVGGRSGAGGPLRLCVYMCVWGGYAHMLLVFLCVCVCVRACVRACVCRGWWGGRGYAHMLLVFICDMCVFVGG